MKKHIYHILSGVILAIPLTMLTACLSDKVAQAPSEPSIYSVPPIIESNTSNDEQENNTSDRQLSEYSREDYQSLSTEQKKEFAAQLLADGSFAEWFSTNYWGEHSEYPWEIAGAKLPDAYNREEYEQLTDAEQEAFCEWLSVANLFDAWYDLKMNLDGEACPWETDGAKTPDAYSMEEFERLSDSQKEQFCQWLSSRGMFDDWYDANAVSSLESCPWLAEGSKTPDQYSAEEYDELTELQKEAFYLWLNEHELFDSWYENAFLETQTYPWEIYGAKRPNDYSWSEYQSLSPDAQEAFCRWLNENNLYDSWYLKVEHP